MATDSNIYKIDQDGITHPFIDREARERIDTLNKRVSNINNAQTEALEAETTRAKNAEKQLSDAKVDIVDGKELSTNDFTDEYKGLLDNPVVMKGATASKNGSQGDVPAPQAGDNEKYLRGDGAWETPPDTTYEKVTQSVDGLMSKEDKKKLDAMDQETDDLMACETKFSGNVITQTFGNGKVRTTTFNADGSISETIAKSGMDTVKLRTTFNADGSISRARL